MTRRDALGRTADRTIAAAVAIAIVLAACGTDTQPHPSGAGQTIDSTINAAPSPSTTSSTLPAATSTTSFTSASTTTTTTTRPPIDDPHIEVNGARLVYRCAGDGDLAVLVDQWLYGPSSNAAETATFMGWQPVVDGVKDRVRICVYNRRGVGGSDNTRTSAALRTTQDMVDDLSGIIEALDLAPVIIVGHSVAGLNMRLLADQQPDLIAGAVFVDASHPDQVVELGGAPPADAPEYLDIGKSYFEVVGKGDMGDKPVYVITGLADKPDHEKAIWLELQQDHAALSTTSQHVVLDDVGHRVPGSSPQSVVDGILWVAANFNE